MNTSSLIPLLLIGIGPSVHAYGKVMIAGWDFAQYAGSNFNVISNSGTFVNTLDANYSDYDPTFGAGAEAGAFGEMYWDGSFGSTNGQASNPADAVPFSLSLSTNTSPGVFAVSFDAHSVLDAEGFDFSNFLSFTVQDSFGGGDGDLVFAATPSEPHLDWELGFASKLNGAGNASVGILFSIDGVNYASVGTAVVTTVDTKFTFPVAGNAATTGFFKLDFSNLGSTGNPVIDNVAILGTRALPEPTAVLTPQISGSFMTVSTPTIVGYSYSLERSTTVSGWSAVDSKEGTGSEITFQQFAPVAGDKSFFRVSTSLLVP